MNFEDTNFLISQLEKGKEAAYIYLIEKYNQKLFGYALALTNNQMEAQDIIQNVFLKIWERRKRMNVQNSLQNYLFKSVHNEFLNHYRKKHSIMLLEKKYFDALEKAATNTDETPIEKLTALINKEIQKLPPKCKEVFILSRKEGLTNYEISEFLDISKKTVEAHITKAFSLLRDKLGDKVDFTLFLLFGIDTKRLKI